MSPRSDDEQRVIRSNVVEPVSIFRPANKCVGRVVPYISFRASISEAPNGLEDPVPRWVLFCPFASETASNSKQALSSESQFERAPTQPHPILVRPPSAPNGLTRRGITSKNTFHTGHRDAIAAGLCLSSRGNAGFCCIGRLVWGCS